MISVCPLQIPPEEMTSFFMSLKEIIEALLRECQLHDYDGWVCT